MKKFSTLFEAWLYGEGGYYQNYKAIGKGGDFFTSVSMSKFFGGSIANYIIKLIDKGELSPDATICEVGAHRGYLLADVVQFLYTLRPELLESFEFVIIERFESLQKEQNAYFEASFGEVVKLKHYQSFDEASFNEGFVFANEIFDAFGCELLYKEKFGMVDEAFKIDFTHEDEALLQKAKKYGQFKGEVAIGYEAFANAMHHAFERVHFVTFDYGDMEPRNEFSARIYQRHQVFPLFDEDIKLSKLYQKSDITYDVNFTHLKGAFEEAGFETLHYKTQMVALVELFGLIELLEILKNNTSPEHYTQEVKKVKGLIDPSVMGERFKMIEFKK